jgi:cytochrome P450
LDGQPLSDADILLNCDNLFVGGIENVRLTASSGMRAFLDNPEQWRAFGNGDSPRNRSIDEIIRWASPATHIVRTVTADTTIRGQQIRSGDLVSLWLPSANRDEDAFLRANSFDIARRPHRHVALGLGEHFCIGAALARAELDALFSQLAQRTRAIELAGSPKRIASIVVNGFERLPVHLAGG